MSTPMHDPCVFYARGSKWTIITCRSSFHIVTWILSLDWYDDIALHWRFKDFEFKEIFLNSTHLLNVMSWVLLSALWIKNISLFHCEIFLPFIVHKSIASDVIWIFLELLHLKRLLFHLFLWKGEKWEEVSIQKYSIISIDPSRHFHS